MLQARDITFSYGEESTILESLDFSLSRGEIVILGGPTGSGKSTLGKILAGYIPRRIEGNLSGDVFIDDQNVEDFTIPQIAKKVSIVQQDVESQLCTLKVADEVAFGPENLCEEENEIINRVNHSLSSVGILHLKHRSTVALSGGEKQRLAIASILSMQPDYIILDEPSSSLDPQGISNLRQILLDLKREGLGVLVIEHQITHFLPIADRNLELRKKKLVSFDLPRATSGDSFLSHRRNTLPKEWSSLLSCDGLSFSYGNGDVISNLSVDLHKEEIVALMGNNGSGKTTLISLLAGVLKPGTGNVFLQEIPIDKVSRGDRIRHVAMVFQNPNHQIFERTVWNEQNIIFDVLGTLKQDQSKSKQLLHDADLFSIKDRNPFSLSYGQKRRLNITSTTVHGPLILLLDEPFIGQDSDGRKLILKKMNATKQAGGLVVLITHDSRFAVNHCDRILFMDEGSILLDGSPIQVLERLSSLGFPEYSKIGGIIDA